MRVAYQSGYGTMACVSPSLPATSKKWAGALIRGPGTLVDQLGAEFGKVESAIHGH